MRDLRARYVGSSMGFFWSVVFPIINLIVYTFVFRLILSVRWGELQTSSEVALIMLCGIVIWAPFAESMSRTTNCLVDNANLIQKVVFPSEIFPVFIVTSSLVNMLIAIPVVLLAAILMPILDPLDPVEQAELIARRATELTEHISVGWHIIALPLLLFLQAVFTAGLGMFFATLNLFWRDTYHLMGVATMVWMFATPIFYPGSLVAKKGYGWILDINPMYWLIESYRSILLYNQWPSLQHVASFAIASVIALAIGSAFFFRQRKHFPDLL